MSNFLLQYATDHQFAYGIDLSVRLHAQPERPDVYYYMFSFDGELNGFKILNLLQNFPGAMHGDELFYLFNFSILPLPVDPTSQALVVRQQMVRLWTNFIKYGNPTPNQDALLGVQWPAVADSQEYLNIGQNLIASTRPFAGRMQLWNGLAETYGNLFNV